MNRDARIVIVVFIVFSFLSFIVYFVASVNKSYNEKINKIIRHDYRFGRAVNNYTIDEVEI